MQESFAEPNDGRKCAEVGDSEPIDVDLYGRFIAGDPDALGTLYSLHHRFLFRFALSMSGDRSKADDLTHEVFLWFIENPRRFDVRRGTLADFLAGVLRKLLYQQWRRERRWMLFDDLAVAGTNPVHIAPSGDPGDDIDASRLRKAIATLPVHYREAVVLCDLERLSYEDAARITGCSIGTMRSRLHRGRNLLMEKFRARRRGKQ